MLHLGVLNFGLCERLRLENTIQTLGGVVSVRGATECQSCPNREQDRVSGGRIHQLTQEHERHAEKLEEREGRENIRRIEGMTCGGVDNECEDTGQGWQRYGDSVVGGSYDEQRSDITGTESQI